MYKARLRKMLVCLLALALFSLAFAGGLAGCKSSGDSGDDGDNNGGSGPSGIAFTRYPGSEKVFMVDEDGSDERVIASCVNYPFNLSFSPSGKQLAATRTGGDVLPELVSIDVASGQVTELTATGSVFRPKLEALGIGVCTGRTCWASEDVLYFTAAMRNVDGFKPYVVRLDLAASKVEIVEEDAKNPALSPDGKKLAYIVMPDDPYYDDWDTMTPGDLVVEDLASGSTEHIFVRNAGQPNNSRASNGWVYDATFSPDGQHMAASVSSEPDCFIYYTDLSGEVVSLSASTGAAGKIQHASFSPDGSKFVYASDYLLNTAGERERKLFIVPSVRSGDIQQTFLSNGGYPAWSPVAAGSGDSTGDSNEDGGGTTGTWTRQTSGATIDLLGVSAVDARTCWAVGDGTILKTTDGGSTWVDQYSGNAQLMAVSAVNSQTCWAVGVSTILKTTDGGSTWVSQDYNPRDELEGVSAVDGQTCWATGVSHNHAIVRTTNGGSTWNTVSMSGLTLIDISAVDANVAYGAGGNIIDGGSVSFTTDGGATWTEPRLSASTLGVCALDRNTCWACATGTVFLTTNGGITWNSRNAGTSAELRAISAVDVSYAIAVGMGGAVVMTTNGGSSWSVQQPGVTTDLWDVSMAPNGDAWAVGSGGTILHYVK